MKGADCWRPRAHLFGHIHRACGVINDGTTAFSNAAIMDAHYDCLRRPVELELLGREIIGK